MMSRAELEQLLFHFNNTDSPYPREKCIHELFEEQVERAPDAIAIVSEGKQLTYRELNDRANQLAHYLRNSGVRPEVQVGIFIERSVDMILVLIGILKAGGVYVPLNPTYPKARLALLLKDADIALLLTQHALVGRIPQTGVRTIALDAEWNEIAKESKYSFDSGSNEANLAYVIYTSGTTGTPKGVCVTHRAVARLVKETHYAQFTAAETFLQLAPISFDASTFEIWGSLLNGARLVIMPPGMPTLDELGVALKRNKITTMWLTAGLFHLMVDNRLEDLKVLRQLLAGGDVLSVSHVRKFLREASECKLINGYGPTESTTFACCYPMSTQTEINHSVPIGYPIANTRVYILDSHLNPVPVGVIGELHIGGDGLARGYFKRPDMTSERFIPDEYGSEPGARLYKTGDRARYLADGNIEFLGRADLQVKVRGFRVELGEIESTLARHEDVREVIVTSIEDTPGDRRLAAYIVLNRESSPEIVNVLRRFAKEWLPDYMVPSVFVLMDALPLTASGKVDRKALPPPGIEGVSAEDFVAPRNAVEEILAGIFARVLQVEQVGIQDNFFDLGGHSLLATQLLYNVNDLLQANLSLQVFYEASTVAELSQAIIANEKKAGHSEKIARVLKRIKSMSADEMEKAIQKRKR